MAKWNSMPSRFSPLSGQDEGHVRQVDPLLADVGQFDELEFVIVQVGVAKLSQWSHAGCS